jgi:hypothetical protein
MLWCFGRVWRLAIVIAGGWHGRLHFGGNGGWQLHASGEVAERQPDGE